LRAVQAIGQSGLADRVRTATDTAGAMLFISGDEIIPETHQRDFENLGRFGLLGGFVCMKYLDATLG
jgi:zinc transporter ZupT